jgi:uncharacterized membrane protein YoaK (UPF0700 family)
MATNDPTTAAGSSPAPGRHSDSLVHALFLLTAVTGIVDAVSYLVLGRVFVANMTGNVVFLGFALSGDKQLSIAASLVALAAFMAGAVIGGRLALRVGSHRGRHLAAGVGLTAVFVGAAFIVSLFAERPVPDAARYPLIVLLALGTGVQNATARRLAVADATTTVLTQTITGLAADSRLGGGSYPHQWRRVASVTLMFAGALVGGLLVHFLDFRVALGLALVLLVVATFVIRTLAARTPARDWAPAV